MSDEKIFDPVTKLWSGPKVDYPYGNDSVGQAAFKSLLAELNHVCQVIKSRVEFEFLSVFQ